MSGDNDDNNVLGVRLADRIAALTRGTVGAVPCIGPIVSELVTQLIPNQRLERMEAYIVELDKRVKKVERDKLVRPRKVDLFEDGAFQAIRSLSGKRTEYIANVVARGLSGEEKEELEAKRMLNLLTQLDDGQIILLSSYLHKNRNDKEFWKIHEDVLKPKAVNIQSSQEEIDEATIQEMAERELVRLGLLQLYIRKPPRGQLPEFDEKTGMMKASGHDITSLGRLFLRYIDLAGTDDL